jgi:hypothetical protein
MKLNIYINRFKFNYNINLIESEYYKNSNQIDEIINNALDILYVKYKSKISKKILTNKSNNSDLFMKYINAIINYLPMTYNTKDMKISFTNFIDYQFIIKNDFTSNLVFNYIIYEIIKLI